MLQIIAELLAWFGLDFLDYKHRKDIRKKEKADGVKRPFQKYILQPSVKIILFTLLVFSLCSFLFFIYQRNSIYPKATKKEILEISNWIEKWQEKYGEYPLELSQAIGNNPMRQDWYKDAWGRAYKYELLDNGEIFLLVSSGKDGEFGTNDDIISK